MWQQLGLVGLFCTIWGVALWLANRLGSKKAQLDALREEVRREMREQERANAINTRVDNMSIDDVRDRLNEISKDK